MTAGAGVDAYIVADIGTMAYCKKYAPSVPLHVSTQAGIVNYLTANEFYNMGAERIVTARELSLSEIAEIRAKTPKELQIECFVHGSMCMSFSGRCLCQIILPAVTQIAASVLSRAVGSMRLWKKHARAGIFR